MKAHKALGKEGNTKAHLITAAHQFFSSRGFHQTSMADLAFEAEVSVGAIYRHFRSKTDIIRAFVDDDVHACVRDFVDLPAELANGRMSLEDALAELALRQIETKDEALGHEILAEAYRSEEIAGAIEPMCLAYRTIFRRLASLANPTLSAQALDGAEELLICCMFGLTNRKLRAPGLSNAEAARTTARNLTAALTTPALRPPNRQQATQVGFYRVQNRRSFGNQFIRTTRRSSQLR